MNLMHLLAVSIRLFSIGLFVYALRLAVDSVSISSAYENIGYEIFVFPVCLVIVAMLLWFFPFSAIANLTRGFAIKEPIKADYSVNEIADFLIVLLGLYMLSHAIADITYWLLFLQLTDSNDLITQLTVEYKAEIAAVIVEAIIACFLIFGRKTIFNFIKSARRRGT